MLLAMAVCFQRHVPLGHPRHHNRRSPRSRPCDGFRRLPTRTERLEMSRRKRIADELIMRGPLQFLDEGMKRDWNPVLFWDVVSVLRMQMRAEEAVQVFDWFKQQPSYEENEDNFVWFIKLAQYSNSQTAAEKLVDEMLASSVKHSMAGFNLMVNFYAGIGKMEKAEAAVRKLREAGLWPNLEIYKDLITGYGEKGQYDEMTTVFSRMKPHCEPDYYVYRTLIIAYSRAGLIGRMKLALKAMTKNGWRVNQEILNALAEGYASMGNIPDMEKVAGHILWGCVPSERTIRAVALVYIKDHRFDKLGTFTMSMRTSKLTLVWNLVILSHACAFLVRGMQDAYSWMLVQKIQPDITTFNILALAYAKMGMLKELRLVVREIYSRFCRPDMVTYGAVVDGYVAGRVIQQLSDALDDLQMLEAVPESTRTDPIVFEAFGKGRFQVFCEEYLARESDATYATITTSYIEMLEQESQDNGKFVGVMG